MIGRTLGHYRVLEEIGSGGMGVVYRARDERLERDVALKVLPAGTLGDGAARKRFRQEALALSQLNHPNIATVHDFDTQDGVDFLVLELIEGETLDARLARGPLTEREVAKLGAQLAGGLEAAHRRGVVHRDIKPGNLRITSEGKLKILDFGLARLVQPLPDQTTLATLTDTQTIVGTLPYMAPEQLAGEKADARSDIYAAGAVLYEMATGRRPFPQSGAVELMYAIMNVPPEAPSAVRHAISGGLQALILKALEKDPDLRYQSARDLHVDLDRLVAPSATVARPRRGGVARVPVWALAAAALLGVLSVLWVLNPGGWRDRFVGRESGPATALAVLPLANLSGDPQQEYFADGMTDELITSLGKISALTVIARSSVMAYKGKRQPLRRIASALGVGSVLEGTVLRAGDRVRVSVQLIRVATGKLVWSESYERSLSDVLALQSEVALAIAREIQVKLTAREQERLATSRAVDPRAHEAYLFGRHHHSNQLTYEGQMAALADFRRAIAIDPGYAMAYAGMGESCYILNNWYWRPDSAMPLVRDAAARALELDPDLADAHALRANVHAFYEWDFTRAEAGFRRACELNPSSQTAHLYYGYFLVNMGRFDEARREVARARELDPLSSWARWFATWPAFYERNYDQAIEELLQVAELDPTAWSSYSLLGEAYEQKKQYPQAIAHLRKARELGGNPWVHAALARTFAEVGQRDSAERVLRDLDTLSTGKYLSPYGPATVYAAMGDHQRAFEMLDRALRERSEDLLLLKIDPRVDRLRSDPRFVALLRRIGLAKS